MVNDEVTKVRVSGDGSTTTVSFSFKYLLDSDIKVYKIDTSVTPEVATLKVLNTDYTITAGSPQGGTVTFTTAPTTDEDAFVKLDAPYTQTVDIPSAGVFREEAIENGLDKTVLLCQQLREEVGRGIQLPETSAITSVSFDTPVDGRALKWRDDGSGNWTAESSDYDPDDAGTYATAAAASASSAASSATDAQTAQTAAEAAQAAAEAAQAAAEAAAGTFTLASQAEAEAGTDNTKYMSALRVAQAIDAQVYIPSMGAQSSVSIGSNIQATKDMLVYGYIYAGTGSDKGTVECFTDTSSTPTTRVVFEQVDGGVIGSGAFCFPVPKNSYFKIVKTTLAGTVSTTAYSVTIGA